MPPPGSELDLARWKYDGYTSTAMKETSTTQLDANAYEFLALRGVQAGAAYYVLMMPLRLVTRLFRFDEDDLSADLRAQRLLNRQRVPAIARYIVEHPKDYVLSALCASVDGPLEFTSLGSTGGLRVVGRLRISMAATLLINDGQHRRAAIEVALRERPALADESIAIVVFADKGLVRAQQMFADLNLHAIRPSRSIGVLYNHRDPFAMLVRDVTRAIPLFRDFVDLERTSISNRALKLFTLSSLYQATRELLGAASEAVPSQDSLERAIAYWSAVVDQMPDWQAVANRQVAPAELRRDYLHSHGVALQALGAVGSQLFALYPKDWASRLERLSKVDWSRHNTKLWEGSVLVGGRVQRSRRAVCALAGALFSALEIPATPDVAEFVVSQRSGRQALGNLVS